MDTQRTVKRLLAVSAVASFGLVVFAVQADKGSGVSVSVKADKAQYDRGETITFGITLLNKGKQPVKLTFPNGQRFDLYIENSGAKIWKWSDGRAFNMMYSTVQLEAGKSQSFSGTWDQKDKSGKQVPPGLYDVYATIASEQLKGGKPTRVQVRITSHSAAVTFRVDVRGKVTRILPKESTAPADHLLKFLVEGKKEADTQMDKAFVSVRTGTKIFVDRRGKRTDGTVADIKMGRTLEVKFEGPLLMSYPAQGGAGTIVVKL